MESIFQRIGGERAVVKVATRLYEKAMVDRWVSPFFRRLDMDQQVRKQAAFLMWAFGGPRKYDYRGLREAHAPLVREAGLTDQHFDRIAELLLESMSELGIDAIVCDEVMQVVGRTRDEVLDR